MDFTLIFNSVLLGIGLAMDAFSVSLANGLNEPCMKERKAVGISGLFALFQAVMPLCGWICVHTVAQYFPAFKMAVPYIALVLLVFIGGKMIYESIKDDDKCCCERKGLTISIIVLQAIATSIDALSVGFTISDYNFVKALLSALIISAVTFVICYIGVKLGKKAGTKFGSKAGILGGGILIFIGLRIFIGSFI